VPFFRATKKNSETQFFLLRIRIGASLLMTTLEAFISILLVIGLLSFFQRPPQYGGEGSWTGSVAVLV
jgi:hypothetical protein